MARLNRRAEQRGNDDPAERLGLGFLNVEPGPVAGGPPAADPSDPTAAAAAAQSARAAVIQDDPFSAGFVLRYLPQFRVPAGEFDGVQVLVSFRDVAHGPLRPSQVRDLAANPTLMQHLTVAVIRAAAQHHLDWGDPASGTRIAVTVPTAALLTRGFLTRLSDQADDSGLSVTALTLGLSAPALHAADDRLAQEVLGLRLRGARLLIDHFGISPADDGALALGAADEIRIHRTLIAGMDDAAVADRVGSIIDSAHRLGIKAIADGVADDLELEHVRRLGIDAVQGPLLTAPVDADRVRELIEQAAPTPAAGLAPAAAGSDGAQGPPSRDRRFGNRTPYNGQAAFVRVPIGEWRNVANRSPIKIADYSWSGIGFFVDRRIVLAEGSDVLLEITDPPIPIRITRTIPFDQGGLNYYGAEFARPGPHLAALMETVALHRVEVDTSDPDAADDDRWVRRWVSPARDEGSPTGPKPPAPRPVRAAAAPTQGPSPVPDHHGTRDRHVHLVATSPRHRTELAEVGPSLRSIDLRIGQRHDLHLPVTLTVVPKKPHRGRKPRPIPAELFNVSVTGAGVISPTHPDLQPGTRVVIEIDGQRGEGKVRRVADLIAPGRTYLGIEFTDDALEVAALALLDGP